MFQYNKSVQQICLSICSVSFIKYRIEEETIGFIQTKILVIIIFEHFTSMSKEKHVSNYQLKTNHLYSCNIIDIQSILTFLHCSDIVFYIISRMLGFKVDFH